MTSPPVICRSSVVQGVFAGTMSSGTFPRPATPASGIQQTSQAIRRLPGVDAFLITLQPKTGGWPLPQNVRSRMESALGASFSDVRIHVGPEATAIGAIAFTWGCDIHFAPGRYDPHTPQGQSLLGHELSHVVQQRAGRVLNPFGNGVAVVQDRALEAEADRLGCAAARQLCGGGSKVLQGKPSSSNPAGFRTRTVQRMYDSQTKQMVPRSGANDEALRSSVESLRQARLSAYLEGVAAETEVLASEIESAMAAGGGPAPFDSRIKAIFTKIDGYIFARHPILGEAWQRSKALVRNPGLYSSVAPQFSRMLAQVLQEVKQAMPDANTGEVVLKFINKHHLLLKSLVPSRQTESANLLHAGIGSASSSNTNLHRRMHHFTSLHGEDYTTMHPHMRQQITAQVDDWRANPARAVDPSGQVRLTYRDPTARARPNRWGWVIFAALAMMIFIIGGLLLCRMYRGSASPVLA